MNVVITAVTGCRNRGVEALVDTLVDQILLSEPDSQITVLTRDLRFDASRNWAARVRVVADSLLPGRIPALKGNRLLRRLTGTVQSAQFQQVVGMIDAADLVIATGGDCFSSDYGSPEHWLFGLRIALDLGTPVYFLGQSIGIFREAEHAQGWAAVAARAFTSFRESRSHRYVIDDLGLDASRTELTADPAFLLPRLDEDAGNRLRNSFAVGIDGRPTVALGVSRGVSNFAGADHSEHVSAWLGTIEMALNEFSANVLLIPHVSTAAPRGDDAVLALELWRATNFDPRVHVISGDYSARDYKTLIAGCDLVIAERMHACIAGLSSAVTTVSVGYSVKAEGIMEDLLGAGVRDAGLLLDLDVFMGMAADPKQSAAAVAIRRAFAERERHRENLELALPAVKARAQRNFVIARELING